MRESRCLLCEGARVDRRDVGRIARKRRGSAVQPRRRRARVLRRRRHAAAAAAAAARGWWRAQIHDWRSSPSSAGAGSLLRRLRPTARAAGASAGWIPAPGRIRSAPSAAAAPGSRSLHALVPSVAPGAEELPGGRARASHANLRRTGAAAAAAAVLRSARGRAARPDVPGPTAGPAAARPEPRPERLGPARAAQAGGARSQRASTRVSHRRRHSWRRVRRERPVTAKVLQPATG